MNNFIDQICLGLRNIGRAISKAFDFCLDCCIDGFYVVADALDYILSIPVTISDYICTRAERAERNNEKLKSIRGNVVTFTVSDEECNSGTIVIGKGCISGVMRFDTSDPVLHEYTLEYEIPHSASKLNAYFELTEGVLLPIDKSYIPPMIDYMLFKFPGSSIMTRRINTFDYYTYAI